MQGRSPKPDAAEQLARLRFVTKAIAPLVADHEVLICYGNEPQTGVLAAESATDVTLTHPYPLDDLVAQTQGMIGYWLARLLHNEGITKPIVAVVTQTVVDLKDAAFLRPSRFVGPAYTASRAKHLAVARGWVVAEDGNCWRRVVPSPEPQSIVEQDGITALLDDGAAVICGGGGGSAVAEDAAGQLSGVEVIVDKGYVAALLATAIGAERLLILTDVNGVMADFGTPHAALIPFLDADDPPDEALPPESMGVKVEACRRFVASTGGVATIGAVADAEAVMAGVAGTTIARRAR